MSGICELLVNYFQKMLRKLYYICIYMNRYMHRKRVFCHFIYSRQITRLYAQYTDRYQYSDRLSKQPTNVYIHIYIYIYIYVFATKPVKPAFVVMDNYASVKIFRQIQPYSKPPCIRRRIAQPNIT